MIIQQENIREMYIKQIINMFSPSIYKICLKSNIRMSKRKLLILENAIVYYVVGIMPNISTWVLTEEVNGRGSNSGYSTSTGEPLLEARDS